MSAPINNLLSRLDGVKRTGPNRWVARCPTRADKHPSMAIRELDDGRILIHDFGGDSVEEILSSIGLTFTNLYPPRADDPAYVGKPERRPFSSDDALRCLDLEATVVYVFASDMAKGLTLTQEHRERLLLAAGRISAAMGAIWHGR